MSASRSLRLAHRGDWRVAPENTLAALAAAIRIPASDGVEFDVQLSRDDVPVLLHDVTLTRVQGRDVRVDALDAAELATLGIPTLVDALTMLGPEPNLNVELKGHTHGDATAAVLRAARGETGSRAVISSFEPPSLVAMAERLPGWALWLGAMALNEEAISLARDLGCRGLSVDWATITPASARAARVAGVEVMAWTVRRRPTYRRLERLGVVAQCVEAAALDGDAA
jgi:glycerophosphoryl diester phosphodiesterase